jgi:hypothetical protein
MIKYSPGVEPDTSGSTAHTPALRTAMFSEASAARISPHARMTSLGLLTSARYVAVAMPHQRDVPDLGFRV